MSSLNSRRGEGWGGEGSGSTGHLSGCSPALCPTGLCPEGDESLVFEQSELGRDFITDMHRSSSSMLMDDRGEELEAGISETWSLPLPHLAKRFHLSVTHFHSA